MLLVHKIQLKPNKKQEEFFLNSAGVARFAIDSLFPSQLILIHYRMFAKTTAHAALMLELTAWLLLMTVPSINRLRH